MLSLMIHPSVLRETVAGWSLPLTAAITASGWSTTGPQHASVGLLNNLILSGIVRGAQPSQRHSPSRPILSWTNPTPSTPTSCACGAARGSQHWPIRGSPERWPIRRSKVSPDHPPQVHGRNRGLPQLDQEGQDRDREEPGRGGLQQVRQLPQLLRSSIAD